ncbi:sugar nucleotide-binding protein [Paenibacillus sp. CC-CFT747]|nr:sugar nucleotide-binding protein [Paenibacillus sp. CC-CFT747]
MERMLVLGASGLVGRALIRQFQDKYELYGTYRSSLPDLPEDRRFRLEVGEIDRLSGIVRHLRPAVVISSLRGSYDEQLALHERVAVEMNPIGSRMYYFSTTNVFDGDDSRPHTEEDTPVSTSDYGSFKIQCENRLKDALKERAVIIRIPAIWGKESPDGINSSRAGAGRSRWRSMRMSGAPICWM